MLNVLYFDLYPHFMNFLQRNDFEQAISDRPAYLFHLIVNIL